MFSIQKMWKPWFQHDFSTSSIAVFSAPHGMIEKRTTNDDNFRSQLGPKASNGCKLHIWDTN